MIARVVGPLGNNIFEVETSAKVSKLAFRLRTLRHTHKQMHLALLFQDKSAKPLLCRMRNKYQNLILIRRGQVRARSNLTLLHPGGRLPPSRFCAGNYLIVEGAESGDEEASGVSLEVGERGARLLGRPRRTPNSPLLLVQIVHFLFDKQIKHLKQRNLWYRAL